MVGSVTPVHDPRLPPRTAAPPVGATALGAGGRGAGRGWAARLERWAAEARVDDAAASRARQRWLQRQAEEEGSLAGVLADLGDAGAPVRVHLRAGDPVVGVVQAVGEDVVAVAAARSAGRVALVALAAVASVRTAPGVGAVTGDRAVVSSLRLVDVLGGLAAERAPVRVVTAGGEVLAGETRWVGRDVLLLHTGAGAGAGRAAAYLPVDALAVVVVGE